MMIDDDAGTPARTLIGELRPTAPQTPYLD